MIEQIILLPIVLPLVAGFYYLLVPKKFHAVTGIMAFLITFANLLVTVVLFDKKFSFTLPWVGIGLDFSLRLYHFSSFIILAVSLFGFLITLYSLVFIRGKFGVKYFFAYFLLTLGLANGAVLADNLMVMLFFWEALLVTLFGFIAIGNKGAFKTAAKAFIIIGISDLCMMIGIVLTGRLAGTLTMSEINLPLTGLSSLAFVLLMIGAISKGGSMPFHSWIPDAATDAPLPFMALVPGALEKLLGIYFLTRISLDMFQLKEHSPLSTAMMTIGALTIILAVMMALIQKDYKRLLSYHAISQVGYMVLGIGTAVPAGIVGGLFHMINNALYKSGLFLTGGSVEKQTGTTNLEELGGLAKKMPITFCCFLITALSISGVWPFNGFFSKELVYDGALERGWIFYFVAVLGSFFTAASFLKLGHAAFLGKLNEKYKAVKEVAFPMWFPTATIAGLCILFGVWNAFPLKRFIEPILGAERLEGKSFAGFPTNMTLVVITFVVLIAAVLNHLYGVKSKGSGLKAVDHIHYAPVLSEIYDRAQKRYLDPYEWGMGFMRFVSRIAFWFDRAIDWIYEDLAVRTTAVFTNGIKKLHNGNFSTYLSWSLVGFLLVAILLLRPF
jgi:NADH-quinone oxidoreductase subunit L